MSDTKLEIKPLTAAELLGNKWSLIFPKFALFSSGATTRAVQLSKSFWLAAFASLQETKESENTLARWAKKQQTLLLNTTDNSDLGPILNAIGIRLAATLPEDLIKTLSAQLRKLNLQTTTETISGFSFDAAAQKQIAEIFANILYQAQERNQQAIAKAANEMQDLKSAEALQLFLKFFIDAKPEDPANLIFIANLFLNPKFYEITDSKQVAAIDARVNQLDASALIHMALERKPEQMAQLFTHLYQREDVRNGILAGIENKPNKLEIYDAILRYAGYHALHAFRPGIISQMLGKMQAFMVQNPANALLLRNQFTLHADTYIDDAYGGLAANEQVIQLRTICDIYYTVSTLKAEFDKSKDTLTLVALATLAKQLQEQKQILALRLSDSDRALFDKEIDDFAKQIQTKQKAWLEQVAAIQKQLSELETKLATLVAAGTSYEEQLKIMDELSSQTPLPALQRSIQQLGVTSFDQSYPAEEVSALAKRYNSTARIFALEVTADARNSLIANFKWFFITTIMKIGIDISTSQNHDRLKTLNAEIAATEARYKDAARFFSPNDIAGIDEALRVVKAALVLQNKEQKSNQAASSSATILRAVAQHDQIQPKVQPAIPEEIKTSQTPAQPQPSHTSRDILRTDFQKVNEQIDSYIKYRKSKDEEYYHSGTGPKEKSRTNKLRAAEILKEALQTAAKRNITIKSVDDIFNPKNKLFIKQTNDNEHLLKAALLDKGFWGKYHLNDCFNAIVAYFNQHPAQISSSQLPKEKESKHTLTAG